jgi:hypothetical protein
MRRFEEFKRTHVPFEDRIGLPEPAEAALGRIVLGFAYLEDTTRNLLAWLGGLNATEGQIVAAQMSFSQKLDAIQALTLHRLGPVHADDGESAAGQAVGLFALCSRAEQLKDSYIHTGYEDGSRSKVAARGRAGLKVMPEHALDDLLLDVADYIVYAALELEGLPLLLDLADSAVATADTVRYEKDGAVVVAFLSGDIT